MGVQGRWSSADLCPRVQCLRETVERLAESRLHDLDSGVHKPTSSGQDITTETMTQ